MGPHSSKWPGYVRAMEEKGRGDGLHGCHMRTKDTWNYEKENVCRGALDNKTKEDAQRRQQ
jgi:hypothetical protein